MPKIIKEFNLDIANYANAFQLRSDGVHPVQVSWLSSNPQHPNYANDHISNNQKGVIWINNDIQSKFYDSLKEILDEAEISVVYDKENYAMTIFGVKIHPIVWCVVPTSLNYTNYSQTIGAYPIIFKENDDGLNHNSFIGHILDRDSSQETSLFNYGYMASSGYSKWVNNNVNIDRYMSLVTTVNNNSLENASDVYNAFKILNFELICHYNTNYVMISYKGYGAPNNMVFPLFCIINGKMTDGAEIDKDIVYCCGDPNGCSNISTDYRIYRYAVRNTGTFNLSFHHHMFIPSEPDICFEKDKEFLYGGEVPLNLKFGNINPFYLDFRNNRLQVQHLFNEDEHEVNPMFRKQILTAYDGLVQFDNVYYADDRIQYGQYYKIDDETYWCPGNYYTVKNDNESYYLKNYKNKVLLKL